LYRFRDRDIAENRDFFIASCIRRPGYWRSHRNITIPSGTEKLELCGYSMVKKARYVWPFR